MRNRKRVLFVCLGNACRSQMAEAFARAYGSDVLEPASAGLTPAIGLPPETLRAMAEKNLDISDQFPKSIEQVESARFDLVINMSGFHLPWKNNAPTEEWQVPDPIVMGYKEHCKVRDQIENLVMKLILDVRRERNGARKSKG